MFNLPNDFVKSVDIVVVFLDKKWLITKGGDREYIIYIFYPPWQPWAGSMLPVDLKVRPVKPIM